MPRTLLIGTPEFTWREWLKEHLNGRDLLILDPAEPTCSLGRVALVRHEKVVEWRFVGTVDPGRSPLELLAGATSLAGELRDDAVIQIFPYRPQPLLRQLAMMLAQALMPTEILCPSSSAMPMHDWPIGPHSVSLQPAFPEMVQAAQRRAAWLKMLEDSHEHLIPMDQICLSGTRLGSGKRVSTKELQSAGLSNVAWAEKCGGVLLIISKQHFDEKQVSTALNVTGASKAMVVDPLQVSGRVCSLARADGSDIGMGMIEELDFVQGAFRVSAVAIPPAPAKILKIGSMTIDSTGRELGDSKPWSL